MSDDKHYFFKAYLSFFITVYSYYNLFNLSNVSGFTADEIIFEFMLSKSTKVF